MEEQQPPHKRARLDDSESSALTNEAVRRLMESEQSSRTTVHFPADAAVAAAASSGVIDSDMACVAAASSSSSSASSARLSPFAVADDWSYVGAKILAPMVRIGTLPMRQLAAQYGATMVYSEELVAKKLRYCVRSERVDEAGRTFIDFTPSNAAAQTQPVAPVQLNSAFVGAASSSSAASSSAAAAPAAPPKTPHNQNMRQMSTLTTVPGERLVVQLGASCAADALAAAQVVCGDARAIDINAGCPKHFSLQGGMGAALLSKPEILADILGTLRRNINSPITCKIRLLHSDRETVELLQRIESMGVSAVALHARHIEDRPRHRALKERVRTAVDGLRGAIPLIYNGDCFLSADDELEAIRAETGAQAIMVARGAMWNASVFRPRATAASPAAAVAADGRPLGMLPLKDVITDYLSIARSSAHHFANTKYCVMEMLKAQVGASELFRVVTRSKDRQGLEDALKGGMDAEPLLTGPYKVPLVLEERPAAEGACHNSAQSSNDQSQQQQGAGAEESKEGSSSHAHNNRGGKPLSHKEKKYAAKQNRQNREGREKAMLEAAAKKNVAATSAAEAASSSASASASASATALPTQPVSSGTAMNLPSSDVAVISSSSIVAAATDPATAAPSFASSVVA